MKNVLFCGNTKVFDGVLTGMLSIFKRSDDTEPITFYIYTADCTYLKPQYTPLTEEMRIFFEKVAQKYNKDNKVVMIDVTDLYNKEFKGCPNEHCYASPYTLLRLLADLVPNMPAKLLYLDCDILFNRDINEIYNVDVTGYEYAAARDQYGKLLVHPNYINAGVLLFNLEYMKQTKILEKARELLRLKHLPFADQSALIRSTTKRKMLKQRFNCQGMLSKKTVIRHFAKRLYFTPYPHVANIKQWHVDDIHNKLKYHQFDDILNEYLALKHSFMEGENHE